MTEAQSPEEIRREIEATRTNLGQTLEDIEDKVSPSRIKERRVEAVRNRWQRVRNSVMGSAENARGSASSTWEDTRGSASSTWDDTTSRVSDRASEVGDTLRSAPDQAMERTRGNPLAAGLIAFGGGLLAASLLPATPREQQAAQALRDRVEEPVRNELSSVGQQARESLQGTAQEAMEEIKGTAQEAAERTRSEAQGSAQSVRSEAERAKDQAQSRS
jgi:hypothetical protein